MPLKFLDISFSNLEEQPPTILKVAVRRLLSILIAGFLLVNSVNKVSSQSPSDVIDSLKNLVDNYPKEDSVWIDLMYDYIYEKQFSLDSMDYQQIQHAALISNKIKYQLGEARMIKYLGWYNFQHSNNEEALNNFYKAETLFSEKDNFMEYTDVGISIASTYLNMQHYDEALESYLKLIPLYDTIADSPGKARPYFYAAKCYRALNDYDNAEKYYLRARDIAMNINFEMGVSIANASLGDIYLAQLRYEKALPLLLDSHSLISTESETNNLGGSYMSLGNCYLGLKQIETAKDNLLKSKSIFLSLGNYAQLKTIYVHLSKVSQYENNPEAANLYIDSAFAISDSIYNINQLKEVEALKAKYETKKLIQAKELAQSNADLSNANQKRAQLQAETSRLQSWIAMGVVILVFFFLWIIFNRLRVIRAQKKELDAAYEELEKTKKYELAASNLKAIKSQMNPHFIFNAVNSIQYLVLQKETIKSYDYLVLFSQMVRTILDHSEREFIPLDEEIDFLNKYLGLEKLRFGDDFDFEIITNNCPKGLSIPSLIIQPFAENAIKHGLLHKSGPKKLTIRFEYESKLIAYVKDNGIGEKATKAIQSKQSNKHKSFSKEAIKRRLELLQERTSLEANYTSKTIMNGKLVEGTVVKIILPVENNRITS